MFARCIAEWADHVLQRSLCWATLILLRASIVDRIAGGLSSIFAKLLHLFDTLRTGIMLPGNDGDFMFSAVFRGMLADLIGHMALSTWKGLNAVRACARCSNLCNRKVGRAAHEVGLEDHDESQWVPLTDEEIFLMVENLAEFVDSGSSDAQCKALATELGFNHQPLGILLDKSVRGLYQPAEQHLTDWMHTRCQDGTANIGVAMIIARMGALRPAVSVPVADVPFWLRAAQHAQQRQSGHRMDRAKKVERWFINGICVHDAFHRSLPRPALGPVWNCSPVGG